MHVETETLFAYFFSFANGASSPSKQKNGWLESLSIFVLGHDITSSYLELIRIWTVFSHIWKTLINPPRLAANKRSPTISQMIQSDLFGMVSLRDLLKGLYICDLQRSGIKLGHELNPHLDGGWNHPSLKNMLIKLDYFPKKRGHFKTTQI